MKRITLLLIIPIVVGFSLAAVAAIGVATVPTKPVIPEVHRSGDDGYFRLQVPLPKDTPAGPMGLGVTVESGDCWLVAAQAQYENKPPADRDDDAEDSPAESATERTFTVTGRYDHGGPIRLTITARTAGESHRPLVKLSFQLPDAPQENPEVRRAWAQQQQISLALADPHGEDSFSHYWNLAIAPRYGLPPNLNEATARFRREPPDLYSVFTGAAAIQESLQLELLGTGPESPAQRNAILKTEAAPEAELPLSSLSGPTIKSHPFQDMLQGRNPQLPPLAAAIPQDHYAVFFADINKEIELADLLDEWGGNLLHQVETSARDFQVRRKVSSQLCLENSQLTRWFGDRVVADMAFTGSDPFLKEGTAFTVLFSLKDRDRFRKQLDKHYAEAVAKRGAVRSPFAIGGHRGVAVVSPDRRVSSCALIVGNTAIVSTSKKEIEKIAAVLAGRLPSLAQAEDFRYMRTIFPQNAKDEDIFIYLSDAHIRNLVGPRSKIVEARRMRCSGNMALIANARLWFKAEKRREPTMKELVDGGYLGEHPTICPDHGDYDIDGHGEPHCSLHNRQGVLTPVDELPLVSVTPLEAARYKAFVENYNRYWTRFFDPIGIRVKMGKDIRIQTCILPLIENSWYDGLAAFSGRSPGTLTESMVLPRTILSLRGHMSTEWLNGLTPLHELSKRGNLPTGWLGDEISLNLCDGQVLFSAGHNALGLMGQEMGRSSLEPLVIGYLGSALNLPTYMSVKVTDSQKAARAIPQLFRALGPRHSRSDDLGVETYSIEDHRGKPLYVAAFNLWVIKLRLYSAVVDDRLVIASRRDIVTELMDAGAKGSAKKVVKQEGNMEMSVYRSAFKQLEETVSLGWQEDLRHACQKNLPLASILLKTIGVPAEGLESTVTGLRGYQPYCPSGGRYMIDDMSGSVTCTVHGNVWQPKQPAAGNRSSKTLSLVNSLERVNARLAFTPEGLMTTVDIRRKGK
ncbi:hypothetical protein Geob_0069 [Geotalea daltonii FRC-32]|uniref:Uncharacterized protein n=1 Tax=Geotalea daltonii (strain DSM 22248 / JCM 15807 / FRC-32) TaxID=316067 RepID=B9M7Y8_GEODF|nr:hypothetical protein [Geotalea daltonii]ACM18446.1 hypothetical protein Geob_0069 [Geotalea daltonii FRC-32]